MNDYRPIDRWDYRLNDLLFGDEEPPGNRLLDEDGNPSTVHAGRSVQGLAALAAVLDKHGASIRPDHLEKAVWWLKEWKSHNSRWHRTVNAMPEFHQAMERLKASPDFIRDGRRARRLSFASHIFALLSGMCVVLAANAWLGNSGRWASIGLTIGALFFSGITASLRDAARDVWQKQDRRYFLQCVRTSRCTEDLLDAGLFAHHPSTDGVRSAEEYLVSRREVRKMQLQLADALYFDWDRYIRERYDEAEQARGWNWLKRVPTRAGHEGRT